MKILLFALVSLSFPFGFAIAEEPDYPKAKVNFEDYKNLVAEVEDHRAERLIDLNTFLKMSIYCNNNFEGNQQDFASKIALPMTPKVTPTTQFAAQTKPRMMALNVPTYLNLYGYGYHKVYELYELVNVDDPRITFEGSILVGKEIPE